MKKTAKKKKRKYKYIVEFEPIEPDREFVEASSKAEAKKMVMNDLSLDECEILSVYREKR